jgi:hypothetical protein
MLVYGYDLIDAWVLSEVFAKGMRAVGAVWMVAVGAMHLYIHNIDHIFVCPTMTVLLGLSVLKSTPSDQK